MRYFKDARFRIGLAAAALLTARLAVRPPEDRAGVGVEESPAAAAAEPSGVAPPEPTAIPQAEHATMDTETEKPSRFRG
jgi:hypothetical protein